MSRRSNPLEPSQRQLRVGERFRHIIADTLRRGHFHEAVLLDLGAHVSISEVRASPDLKHATAYVVALGGQDLTEVIPALNRAAPVFQKAINRDSNLKFTPKIRFKEDEAFEYGQKIESILSDINKKS